MSDLLASLGLEFVNPNAVTKGLKSLKPSDEPQIFSVISSIPGLENTVIRYQQHDFFNQIKRKIRCSGGACCQKAKDLGEWLNTLPDDDLRKRQRPYAQTRLIIPVVLYQGKTIQAYGGPIEVRYINIAEAVYNKWDSARSAVNEEIAPFYQRDFIMTSDPNMKGVPIMTHTESKAKWLTDPAINAEVLKIASDPEFINNYVKIVPARLDEQEFLGMWNAAMNSQTAAEKAVAQKAQAPIQPAVSVPGTAVQFPTQDTAYKIDMSVLNTPQINAVQPTVQPMVQPAVQQIVAPQPQPVQVQPVAPAPAPAPAQEVPQVALNTGMPMTQTNVQPTPEVAYTPQNIINGSYTTATLNNVVSPESIVNMQPVSIAPANIVEQVQPAQAQPVVVTAPAATEVAPAPMTSQSEINLNDIGDLDAIINSLPQ